jgi:hypothetical protein
MWDLAGGGSSRQAPLGTESVPEKHAGTGTLGWPTTFAAVPFPLAARFEIQRSGCSSGHIRAYFPISKLEIIPYN